jgi:carbon starvation protein
MLALIFLLVAVILFAAYRFYGRYLERRFGIDDRTPTPSHTDYDGIDRVPAHRAVLLGHHFSSIAGAGPIVGPIIASVAFGWLPALLWIVLGVVFIGGVHDFSSLVGSIRHKARSIAEIAKLCMSPPAYKMLLAFIWLSLIYVLTVFTDLTAETFVSNGGVVSSSVMFILLAVLFGLSVHRLRVQVVAASVIFVPLLFLAVWLGQLFPIPADSIPRLVAGEPAKTWSVLLLLYCFVASTTPVWILLQPRDYLSSYLLYASVLAGFFGILFGGFAVRYPAFNAWHDPQIGALLPILFITVACGACSGFHAIVASGTSSKQLDREGDARLVGYGAMLIEGLVAVIALATVIMLPKGGALAGKPPLEVYGRGMGRFASIFGLPPEIGFSFGLLALSTFILTTLDTATRLGRYVLEEFFGIKDPRWRYASTLVTLALPAVLVLVTLHDVRGNPIPAWKAIWPVFGATNQLLAGLTLLVVAVWLKKRGKGILFVLWPMAFMIAVTVWALLLLIDNYRFSAIGVIAMVLLALAGILVREAVVALKRG